MSDALERQKARSAFLAFLQHLDACPPTWTGLNEPDPTLELPVEVPRAKATDCFLRTHPSWERFRDDLASVRRAQATFTFKKASWHGLYEQ